MHVLYRISTVSHCNLKSKNKTIVLCIHELLEAAREEKVQKATGIYQLHKDLWRGAFKVDQQGGAPKTSFVNLDFELKVDVQKDQHPYHHYFIQ